MVASAAARFSCAVHHNRVILALNDPEVAGDSFYRTMVCDTGGSAALRRCGQIQTAPRRYDQSRSQPFIAKTVCNAMVRGTHRSCRHYGGAMTRYRFVTPHRTGKWYPDLKTAMRQACTIGAGFLEERTGRFVAYAHTRLEKMRIDSAPEPVTV